jgi:hypothetical protein
MALKLEIKSIMSPDLESGAVPDEADHCSVFLEVEIGESGKEGADIFSFTVVTPKFLASNAQARWGRGYLIVDEFSWTGVESMLARLLQRVRGDSWPEVANELAKELNWEFEGYQEHEPGDAYGQ